MKKEIILGILVFAITLTGCNNNMEKAGSVHKGIDIQGQTAIENHLSKNNLPDGKSDESDKLNKKLDENEASDAKEQERTSNSQSIQAQLKIIASNIDLWAKPEEYANDVYNYAITDLDSNGRLEIIASNSGGTGIYTYSTFYEINEEYNGLTICDYITQEGDSQADIAVDSVPGFYDSQKGIIYYIFDDLLKNGAAEYYENKRALYLADGQVKEIPLAYKLTIYTDTIPKTTYMDQSQKEISEEKYNTIADHVFTGMVKKKINFGWCEFFSPAELTGMSEKELINMLMESYEKFGFE